MAWEHFFLAQSRNLTTLRRLIDCISVFFLAVLIRMYVHKDYERVSAMSTGHSDGMIFGHFDLVMKGCICSSQCHRFVHWGI